MAEIFCPLISLFAAASSENQFLAIEIFIYTELIGLFGNSADLLIQANFDPEPIDLAPESINDCLRSIC